MSSIVQLSYDEDKSAACFFVLADVSNCLLVLDDNVFDPWERKSPLSASMNFFADSD